ncbi:armadillo repeat-containing protein 6 homolog [Diorhabda carinulata]|uniref:armadillo repeat-containing protein 6 homolog n=1 Tax=Diorhabda carinulata TaxID=1163345 RepID=UPI0025A145C4|nr:armadillo repeat-containing protein 6 homolog [Diorhabda carinulata]
MVLVISQDTFDNAVRENIEDLGLEPEEALQEAVKQFESQGVDLSSIIKELSISPSVKANIETEITKLKKLTKKDTPDKELMDQMEIIKEECDKGLVNRVGVGKAGAYNALLDVLEVKKSYVAVERTCLKTLISLMNKQPDLLDERGVKLMLAFLNIKTDFDVKKLTLRWIKSCCVLHENNRQNIFDANILDKLKDLLNDGSSDILREVLAVCRSLVLDDDVRVEFGKAHEHARIIASEILCPLTQLMARFKGDEPFIHDLMLTVSALMVRTEFCKKVHDAGGIEMIAEVMNYFSGNERINKQCFKLIKCLAGNDICKANMLHKNMAPAITKALTVNKGNVSTAVSGLTAIAALTLRSPENSKTLFEADIPAAIVDIMKMYPDNKEVQKSASRAVRNMVSRSRYQNKTFIELGIDEILQSDLKKFKDIEYDIKAALRDLGCNVKFNEEWTGKGGALTTGGKLS